MWTVKLTAAIFLHSQVAPAVSGAYTSTRSAGRGVCSGMGADTAGILTRCPEYELERHPRRSAWRLRSWVGPAISPWMSRGRAEWVLECADALSPFETVVRVLLVRRGAVPIPVLITETGDGVWLRVGEWRRSVVDIVKAGARTGQS
jgi:hypothetical protein